MTAPFDQDAELPDNGRFDRLDAAAEMVLLLSIIGILVVLVASLLVT